MSLVAHGKEMRLKRVYALSDQGVAAATAMQNE
jgi:hypothetical protein